MIKKIMLTVSCISLLSCANKDFKNYTDLIINSVEKNTIYKYDNISDGYITFISDKGLKIGINANNYY
ncbi:MAG: hypothetical protein KBA61_12425, partial [Spirochaetes bacterium]|nr:hypothetical protein [Spirochaetota bacterium]